MRIRTAAAAAALMIFCASARGAEELVTLPVRDGVTQSYLLLHDTSAMPKVIVVTFIGGTGGNPQLPAEPRLRARNPMMAIDIQ